MKLYSSKDIKADVLNNLSRQNIQDFSVQREQVLALLESVRADGDKALCVLTKQFDGVDLALSELRISNECMETAVEQVDEAIQKALQHAKKNIEQYQKTLMPQGSIKEIKDSVTLGSQMSALNRVGVYIPGGSAPLVSTVLMTVVPALVAGVQEIVVMSPPTHEGDIHPAILYACQLCGVTEIYRVGGAQAIAAMAYGTETIKSVDKIVGPGNIYVTLAKKEVFGVVDIDMVAGPSEIMVLADATVPVDWVAYDLMSQAEHDPLAASYLVCTDQNYAQRVIDRFEELMQNMPRKDIIAESWANHACVFVVDSIEEALDVVASVAPEHLQLMVADAEILATRIHNAGAIFIGTHTPEAVGDYMAGPSHVLPTSGSARFFSPLSVLSFIKQTSILSYSKAALHEEGELIVKLARLEGLEAHARSVEIRLEAKD